VVQKVEIGMVIYLYLLFYIFLFCVLDYIYFSIVQNPLQAAISADSQECCGGWRSPEVTWRARPSSRRSGLSGWCCFRLRTRPVASQFYKNLNGHQKKQRKFILFIQAFFEKIIQPSGPGNFVSYMKRFFLIFRKFKLKSWVV
jgi:hypothetical protein